MIESAAPLPCGRSVVPWVARLHYLEDGGQLGAVINNLSGAWLGGGKKEIRKVFDHLRTGTPRLDALSSNAQAEIQRSEILTAEVDQPTFRPHLAVVHVGHVCNIDCTYCYAPKTKKAMAPETMESVTDFIATLPHNVFVQFMGGEPLLYRDQISRLIGLLERKRQGLETTYGLQTNGLCLLDKGVLEFLDKRKIRFGISYDGPGTMSEARFERRLPLLQDKLERVVCELTTRGYKFGILAVLNRSNQGRLPLLIDWCLDRGIRHLLVNPLLLGQGKNSTHGISNESSIASMRELFRYWVDNKLYKKIDIENFQAFEDNATDLGRPYMCRKQSCGAGREQLAFDTAGNVFPCDYLVGEEQFRLGNTRDVEPRDIEFSAYMKSLHDQVQPDNLRDCRGCPMFAFCGNCMASSYFHDGTLNGRRGSCHTDFSSIKDIVFELLSNEDYRDHVLNR